MNVLGLSIGIAGLIFAILYWNDEQSYDQWNPERDEVFAVLADIGKDVIWSTNPGALEPYLKSDSRIANVVYYDWYQAEVFKYKGKTHVINKTFNTQNDFFELFPFETLQGNVETALSKENSIAMNEKTAQKFFGNENPIGKQIIHNKRIVTVTAIYSIPGNSSIAPNIVINDMKSRINENKEQWGNFNFPIMIKLKNPNDKAAIEKKLNGLYYQNKTVKESKSEGISIKEYINTYGSIKSILDPLNTIRLHSTGKGMLEGQGNYQFLMIMVGLSILILILSMVNYINLATANAIKRAKEVGVRKIIGATKSNIILQFIFETVLTTLLSILLALVIVELSLPYYNNFLGKDLIIFGNQFFVQLIIIFIMTVVVAGIFPAVYIANFETLKVLKGNFGRSKSGVWIRNGMLIVQFAIASFFIIGSYIVYQQVNYLANKDLGFVPTSIISVYWDKQNIDFSNENYSKIIFNNYTRLTSELNKIKGVQGVSTGTFRFGGGNDSSSSFSYKSQSIQAQNLGIDFNMLDMMQIKIKEGRNISADFASDTISAVLINETALRMMNEKNPIGKVIDWNSEKLKIIGIVKDFNLFSPQSKVPPMVFFHLKTIDWIIGNINDIYIKIDTENSDQILADIEKVWKKNVESEFPFEYEFLDKSFARTYESYVKQKNLFSLLNVVVILIAIFGLFSLASFSIQRRMKEIAIRKTLGAETNVLLKELSKQYIIFCGVGFLIALLPVYYLLSKWLENFAYRIEITVLPFIIGFLILLLFTLIVVLFRAYQATRVDVLKYLKYE